MRTVRLACWARRIRNSALSRSPVAIWYNGCDNSTAPTLVNDAEHLSLLRYRPPSQKIRRAVGLTKITCKVVSSKMAPSAMVETRVSSFAFGLLVPQYFAPHSALVALPFH
jgi:hypothetical protein